MKPTACSESHEHDLESSGSGTGGASKTDEFSEKFQRRGSFSIQKIIGFWTLKRGILKKIQYDFQKMRGEGGGGLVKGCLELFRKLIRFWGTTLPSPLTLFLLVLRLVLNVKLSV